jgi:hypothetical protein
MNQSLSASRHRPIIQFSLRALLLLCAVLGSSLAVFGAWGVLVFVLVVGLSIFLRNAQSGRSLIYLVVAVLFPFCVVGLLFEAIRSRSSSAGVIGVLVVVATFCVAITIYLHKVKSLKLLICLVFALTCLSCVVGPLLLPYDIGPHRPRCPNRMHQVGVGLCNYHEAHGCFPPAYTADGNDKPLHSWRTLVLPYIDDEALYRGIDLKQPWDAQKQNPVFANSLLDYTCPNDPSSHEPGTTQTNYFAVVGPNAAWSGKKPRKFTDFGEEASHTIMLVEVADSGVSWAEPRDFSIDALAVVNGQSQALSISSNHRPPDEFFYKYDAVAGGWVVLANLHVCFLRTDDLSADQLRKVLQVGGFTDEVSRTHGDRYAGRRLNWPNIAALTVWLLSVATLMLGAVRGRKMRGEG